MKKVLLFISLFLCPLLYRTGTAQPLSVNGSVTALDLAQNLVGSGITVSNVVLDCASGAFGTFNGSTTNLAIDGGILLTSGSINNAVGPNNQGGASTGNGFPGDADLNALGVGNTFDACVLEFDFIPIGDVVSFDYIFGSEEYLEYVGSNFNDAFALFISGPGITGLQNLAIIPGTNTPVSINNVNNVSYPAFYVNNTGGATVQYDGFTRPMTAQTDVIPCMTYHLKLVVADVGDSILDSGVFLEEGSLSSNGVEILPPTSSLGSGFDFAQENCATGTITFQLEFTPSTPFALDFEIGGTATMGVDYEPINNFIVFAPGQTTYEVNIIPIADNSFEGDETVEFYIYGLCDATPVDIGALIIRDGFNSGVVNSEISTCDASEVIQLQAFGGDAFAWSPTTGMSNPNISNPTVTGIVGDVTYTVTVTNGPCDMVYDVDITVGGEIPSAVVGGDIFTCPGQPLQFFADGGENYQWTPMVNLDCYDCQYPFFTPGETTTYTVTITQGSDCMSTFEVTAHVEDVSVDVAANVNDICSGLPVQLTASGGYSQFLWTDGLGNPVGNGATITVSPTETTEYFVEGVASGDCNGLGSIVVDVIPGPVLAVNAPNPDLCNGESINLVASGATGYEWFDQGGNSISTSSTVNISPDEPTVYTVVGTGNGCESSLLVPVSVTQLPGTNVLPQNPTICPGGSVELVVVDAQPGDTYAWSPATGLSATSGSSVTASPSASTTYTLTAESAGGCVETVQIDVGIDPNLSISVNAPPFICTADGPATITAFGADTYTWSPADGLSATTGASVEAQPSATTTYNVFGEDASGCTGSFDFTIVVNESPAAAVSPDPTVCAFEPTQLEVTPSAGSGAYSFSWTPATGLDDPDASNPVATVQTTTVYTVAVLDDNGCEATNEVTVNINPLPDIVITASETTVCAADVITLTATGGTDYVWSGSGLIETSGAVVTAAPTANTAYVVTVTGANGCTGANYIDISVIPSNLNLNASTTSLCPGESAVLTASGSTTYAWSPADGLSNTIGNSVIATPSETTTYTVTGASSGGACPVMNTVTIEVSELAVDLPEELTICSGTPVDITASGGTDYAWSPADGLNTTSGPNVMANPTSDIVYTVTVTDALGCTDEAEVSVSVSETPDVSVSPPNPNICPGSFMVFTLDGADFYTFEAVGGEPFTIDYLSTSLVSIIPTQETEFNIIGTDANGCEGYASATISIKDSLDLNVSLTEPVVCPGGDSTVLTATGASEYIWTPASSLNTNVGSSVNAHPNQPTNYTVYGSTIDGCVGQASIFVDWEEPPGSVDDDVVMCVGESVTLGADGGVSYAWEPSESLNDSTLMNPTASPDTTTTYTVYITHPDGCYATREQTVTVEDLDISASANVSQVCAGDPVTLSAQGASSYTWTANGNLIGLGSAISHTPAENTTYVVTGTSVNGCVDTETISVSVNPLPEITAGDVEICAGETATLSASGAISYAWEDEFGSPAGNGNSIDVSPASSTFYSVIGTTTQGCSEQFTVNISVNDIPTVTASASSTAICAGETVDISANGASTYEWLDQAGTVVNVGANVSFNPSGTTTYTVVGTDGNGCESSDEVTITVNAIPALTASASDPIICEGQSVTLNGSGANIYVWLDEGGTQVGGAAAISVTPAATTTYTLQGTSSGCVSEETVTVTVETPPDIAVNPPVATICPGGSTTLGVSGAGAGGTYDWSPTTGLTVNPDGSATAAPASDMVYTVTGTTAEGCANTTTVSVSIAASLTIGVSPSNPVVCSNGGGIALSASGADSYTWSPATGLSATTGNSVTANPASNTTYTVEGADASGCSGSITFDVVVADPPAIDAGPDLSTCEGGTVSLNVDVPDPASSSFLWSPAADLDDADIQSPSATLLAPTTYQVTVTDNNGCESTDEVNVTIDPAFDFDLVADFPAICAGGTGTAITASGADTYAWSPPAGLSSLSGSTVTASPNATTLYTVTATDVSGCTSTNSISIEVTEPDVSVGAVQTSICVGESTFLSASGASTYTWSPATGLNMTTGDLVEASPLATTTYTVVGDVGGCTDQASITITVSGFALSLAPLNPEICEGDQIELTASGGDSYNWSPADGLSATSGSSVTASPDATTTYTVTAEDAASGCTTVDTITVEVNPLPTVAVSPPDAIMCLNGSLNLTASGAASYSWSPADGLSATSGSSVTASPDADITYTVVGTTAAGCTGEATVDVTIAGELTLAAVADPPVVCSGNSTTITVTGADDYIWSPATGLNVPFGDEVIATPAFTQTYTVTGTTADGCQGTTTILIEVSNGAAADAGDDEVLCPGDEVLLVASGGVDYEWSPATGLSNPNIAFPIASPDVTTTYSLTVTDAAGCTGTDELTITVAAPEAEAGSGATICEGESVVLQGSGGDSYFWIPAAGLDNPSSANPTATPGATTMYYLTTFDANGCTAADSVEVVVEPAPTAAVTPDVTVCEGETAELTASGGTDYVWSNAETTASITVSPLMETTYSVTVSTSPTCSDVAEVTVFVNPLPTVDAGEGGLICFDESWGLSNASATNYTGLSWTGGTGSFSDPNALNPTYTPGAGDNGLVTLVLGITSDCGVLTDTVELTVLQSDLDVDAGLDLEACEGGSFSLNASGFGGDLYQWSGGSGNFDNPNALQTTYTPGPGETGEVTLTLSASNVCENMQDAVTVTIDPLADVEASEDVTIGSGESIGLSASGADTYIWADPFGSLSCIDCPNPTATPLQTTVYYVTGNNFCADIDSLVVTVEREPAIFMPTAFSPNGDGTNDKVRPMGYGYELVNFRIYDRYGAKVYDSPNPNDAWDGIYKGEKCQVGVYVFVVEYIPEGRLGGTEVLKGNITLIR